MGYADDTFLEAEPAQAQQAWHSIVGSLEAHGHEIQPSKCHLWHPRDTLREPQEADAFASMTARIPATTGHLTIMGTEGGRQYETAVGPDHAQAAEAARSRAEAACELCLHLQELISADLGHARLQVTWSLLTKCAARALDYDARLVPPSGPQPSYESP